MSWLVQTISLPDFGELTEQVLHGIGVRKLILNITPEVERIIDSMPGFNIENYMTMRIKEHISAHIFVILMQENNKKNITISTTSLIQDIKNGRDIRLRWLYGNPELVYADMTGSQKNYERKKRSAISGSENKINIYIPHHLTEYCYEWLQKHEIYSTPRETIEILIEEYRKNMRENETIKIKTYDLRKRHEEKTYLFYR